MANNIINDDIIEKVVIKSVAIYKAMSVLPAPPFEDKFKKETLCQQNENIQKQNLEKCLKETEQSKENEIIDTTNDIKKNLEKKSWKDITNPKERQKAYRKAYREANKEKLSKQNKDYVKINKDRIKIQRKDYYKINRDKIKEQSKSYRESNKDKIKDINKKYKDKNKVILKEKQKIYAKKYREENKQIIKEKKKLKFQREKEKINHQNRVRYSENINYKLKCRLRHRLRMALKGNFKSGSAVDDLGCSIPELKVYLESKFSPGMTWDNWNDVGWHIDHIKPLASFDLTDRKQFLEACHYTNLQPLWAKDNLIKSDNIL
jgi:hypothetical protein